MTETKTLSYCKKGLGFGSSKSMEAMGLDLLPKILINQFDDIDENIEHIVKIEKNIGQAQKYWGI